MHLCQRSCGPRPRVAGFRPVVGGQPFERHLRYRRHPGRDVLGRDTDRLVADGAVRETEACAHVALAFVADAVEPDGGGRLQPAAQQL